MLLHIRILYTKNIFYNNKQFFGSRTSYKITFLKMVVSYISLHKIIFVIVSFVIERIINAHMFTENIVYAVSLIPS